MQKLTILCAAFLFFPLLAKADNDVPLTDTPDDSLDVWNQNLNEVVVTGQGAAVSKRRLSSNITKLSTADLEKLPTDRIDQMLREFAMRLEQQGMKFEQYLQYSGGDLTKLRAQYRETAEKNVRTDLMLEAVAKAENIEVTGDDIRTEIAMMAQMYNATPAQVQKIVRQQGRLNDLAVTVMRRKTAKFIVDNIAE